METIGRDRFDHHCVVELAVNLRPFLVRINTRHRGNTGNLARGVAATSALSRLDDPGIPLPGEDSDYQIGFDPAFSRIATARFVHN